jgi:hypothetical protein
VIDYVKILINNNDDRKLEEEEGLDFKTEVSVATGTISKKKVAEYHFCKIIIYDSGTVYFSGSLHKLYNSLNGIKAPNFNQVRQYKGFNGNQFTLHQIIDVRTHLCGLFDCEPSQLIIQNIEFGVNTTPGFDPNLFLKGLLMHKGKPFEYRFNNNYSQVPHNRFILKIYNKSYQYGLPEYVLRFEVKIIKSEELKQIGIRTFEDISIETLKEAKKMLIRRLDEVLYYDYTIDKSKLTNREKALITNYSNPRYWLNELLPRHRDRHKKRLQKLTINNSDNLKEIISNEIKEKCVIINQPYQKPNRVMINTSSIELPITHSQSKKCPITGLSLEHEKQGSNYIKTTTLNYIRDNDEKTYSELCSLLLNDFKGNRPKFEKNIITHLAKQVRNRFYNRNMIKRAGYNKISYPDQLELLI